LFGLPLQFPQREKEREGEREKERKREREKERSQSAEPTNILYSFFSVDKEIDLIREKYSFPFWRVQVKTNTPSCLLYNLPINLSVGTNIMATPAPVKYPPTLDRIVDAIM
tara:strand:+ start:548 stop:880 length:333 start_codon:yes stop_codon:yes gene_type:complete